MHIVIFGRSSLLDFYRLAQRGVAGILGAYSTAVAIWSLLPAHIFVAGYIQHAEELPSWASKI
jgi:hypothetical protein